MAGSNHDSEWLLQFAILCCCLGDAKRLEQLDANDFDAEFGAVIAEMKRKESRALDELLGRQLKVTRTNGTKWWDLLVKSMNNVAAWNRLKRENEPMWTALRMALWSGRRAETSPDDVLSRLKGTT